MRTTPMSTPWGPAQYVKEIIPGIWHVSTSSHGGYKLSRERQSEMDRAMPWMRSYAGDMWLEEDCDMPMAWIMWPEHFSPEQVHAGARAACQRKDWDPAFANTPLGRKVLNIAFEWEREHAGWWTVGGMTTILPGRAGYWKTSKVKDLWDVNFFRNGADGVECLQLVMEYPVKQWYSPDELREILFKIEEYRAVV